jgi:transaldolase
MKPANTSLGKNNMIELDKLNIDIYADGADLDSIKKSKEIPYIKGFTTNPTLMRQAGVTDYEAFAKDALEIVEGSPLSLEVFSDDLGEMDRQARKIASWGENVNVKIPITNTKGESSADLVKSLSDDGIICNITAIFTIEQTQAIIDALNPACEAIISIFAGRIADTGLDPMPLMREAVEIAKAKPKSSVLWASPREALNIIQADETGCGIITVTSGLLKKAESSFNKDLGQFSVETVKMFYNDASASGYNLSDQDSYEEAATA